MTYLGSGFTEIGFASDEAKVKAVVEWPTPGSFLRPTGSSFVI